MERRPFLDPNHPMFARPWVRWLVSLGPMAWAAFEFLYASPMWGVIFLAIGAYALKTLILDRK